MKSIRQKKRKKQVKDKGVCSVHHLAYLKYAAYQRRYRETHRDYYREYARKYRQEHPRKPLGERYTQAVFETRDPKKLKKALEKELKRLHIRKKE